MPLHPVSLEFSRKNEPSRGQCIMHRPRLGFLI